MRFFTDRFKDQNLTHKPIFLNFYHEGEAINYPLSIDMKRVWIEIDIPTDEQLWPDYFKGVSAAVTSVEVQHK